MLVAEDLLLLLLDDESGALSGTSYADTVLGGAVLTDLALAGAVTVPEKTSVWRSAKVHAVPGVTPRGPVAARRARDRGREGPLRPGPRGTARQGSPGRRSPSASSSAASSNAGTSGCSASSPATLADGRRQPRAGRTPRAPAVLVDGAQPDEHTGALVALLAAIDRAHKAVDARACRPRVRRRAKQIAEGAMGRQGGEGRHRRGRHRRDDRRGHGGSGDDRRRLRQLTPQRAGGISTVLRTDPASTSPSPRKRTTTGFVPRCRPRDRDAPDAVAHPHAHGLRADPHRDRTLHAATPGAVIVRVTRARSGLPTAETCSSGTVWTGVVGVGGLRRRLVALPGEVRRAPGNVTPRRPRPARTPAPSHRGSRRHRAARGGR